MKKIIIIHEDLDISPLYGLFKSLIAKGLKLSLFSNDKKFIDQFEEFDIRTNKIHFCQNVNSNLRAIFYILLCRQARQEKPGILCFSRRAQILLPLICFILKLELIIFRSPQNKDNPILLDWLVKKFSRWAKYWVLCETEKILLQKKVSKKAEIFVLPVGINLSANAQDNLFDSLARARRGQLNRKFFSVGALAIDGDNYLENLLSAGKKCLNVIKEFQLIVICDIKTKNKVQWLAKKLEIDSLVWFVGKEILRRKWCDNLDVYVAISSSFSLPGFYHLLSAQAGYLPVIAPENNGFDEIIINNQSGFLVNMENSDDLSQTIINLYRSRQMREQTAQKAVEIIKGKYLLDKISKDFVEIYNE
ncbi:MAG: glycosyltransferase [Patescibacteria group bacterium]|nr:glycosyltransferase [Patescibacteria group bacterium]